MAIGLLGVVKLGRRVSIAATKVAQARAGVVHEAHAGLGGAAVILAILLARVAGLGAGEAGRRLNGKI